MQALKDVGEITPLLGKSALTDSPIWETALERAHPMQLHAFLTRLNMDNRGEEGKLIVETVLAQVRAAHARGEVPEVPLMRFAIPQERITLGDIRTGLEQLARPRPAAVLFGLEANLEIDDLITLKWDRAQTLRTNGTLSKLALDVLRLTPRHLRTPYVFWQELNGTVAPLFGLSLELADVFDMEWPELRRAYRTVIKLDVEVERLMWLSN
jgi:hypothetical protein